MVHPKKPQLTNCKQHHILLLTLAAGMSAAPHFSLGEVLKVSQ